MDGDQIGHDFGRETGNVAGYPAENNKEFLEKNLFGFLFCFYLFFGKQTISQSPGIQRRRDDTRQDPGTELINLKHKFSEFGSIDPEKICRPEIIGWAKFGAQISAPSWRICLFESAWDRLPK